MWVFTTDGFFSIVKIKSGEEDELAVRARCKADLERFLTKIGQEVEILEFVDADYSYIVHVNQDSVVEYLAAAAQDINYTNFKDACCAVDPCRAAALHSVWKVTLDRWGVWE